MQPYHKYVFDLKRKKFIGAFEKMYKDEDNKVFDSWFQEDIRHFTKQISLVILNKYNFSKILDLGCGKGTFTSLLKRKNNYVLGIDLSKTAIKKAKSKYPDVDFKSMTVEKALNIPIKWDLIVVMELLSYLNDWNKIIKLAAKKTKYIYISLFVPDNPIGFVKSVNDLKEVVSEYFTIDSHVIFNTYNHYIFAEKKDRK